MRKELYILFSCDWENQREEMKVLYLNPKKYADLILKLSKKAEVNGYSYILEKNSDGTQWITGEDFEPNFTDTEVSQAVESYVRYRFDVEPNNIN